MRIAEPLKTQDNPDPPSLRRVKKRNPEASRLILINAALDTIAEVGITETSVSSIIQRAQLSRGMIHLHFGGKDNLLTAAAEHFSAEYYAAMDRVTNLGPSANPEDVVVAVIRADLSEAILNPRSAKIWHAFRGVANSHTGIAKYSSTQDAKLVSKLNTAFRDIAAQDGYEIAIADDATNGTLAMLEGLWVTYMANRDDFSRENSLSLILRFLEALFPRRFEANNGFTGKSKSANR